MATTKKAAAKSTQPLYWFGVMKVYKDCLWDGQFWELGEYPSFAEAATDKGFAEFMREYDYPEAVYVIGTDLDGKPYSFRRVEVTSSGYAFKDF